MHGLYTQRARLAAPLKVMPQKHIVRKTLGYLAMLFVLFLFPVAAQVRQTLPQYDQSSRQRGQTGFGAACAFCHGGNARGGEGGVDLLHSVIVLQDEGGKQLLEFLQKGRPDRGMPAFPNLTADLAADLATFLHAEVLSAVAQRTVQVNIVTGDPKAGEAFFNGQGRCNACHSVTGDLKGIGSKYDPIVLQDKAMSPRGAAQFGATAPGPKPIATVTLSSGEQFRGPILRLSLFHITIMDQQGIRRTFTRDGDVPEVEVQDPLQGHIDNLLKITDQNMHDLTAYLVTLK